MVALAPTSSNRFSILLETIQKALGALWGPLQALGRYLSNWLFHPPPVRPAIVNLLSCWRLTKAVLVVQGR
jgi:hypothetical protein